MTPYVTPQAARPLRIAIVEDEALIACQMEIQLAEAGHEVVGTADTFEEAIALIETTNPHLALVDIQLADGASGLAVAAALQARGVACLLASGSCPPEARGPALGCLHKPYSPLQLLDAVAAADAITRGERPPHLPAPLDL